MNARNFSASSADDSSSTGFPPSRAHDFAQQKTVDPLLQSVAAVNFFTVAQKYFRTLACPAQLDKLSLS
jgi:hypothetical protein